MSTDVLASPLTNRPLHPQSFRAPGRLRNSLRSDIRTTSTGPRSLHRCSRHDLLETLVAHIYCRALSAFFAIFEALRMAAPAQRSLRHMISLYFGSATRSLHRCSRHDLLETLVAHIYCRALSAFFAILEALRMAAPAQRSLRHMISLYFGSATCSLHRCSRHDLLETLVANEKGLFLKKLQIWTRKTIYVTFLNKRRCSV